METEMCDDTLERREKRRNKKFLAEGAPEESSLSLPINYSSVVDTVPRDRVKKSFMRIF